MSESGDFDVSPRYMGLQFEVVVEGQHVATARLRYDVAPRTSSAIASILPLTGTIMHVSSSGEGVFFSVDVGLDIDLRPAFGSEGVTAHGVVVQGERIILAENQTCYVSQGDFVLTPYKACIIAYGRRCVIRSYGGELPSNAFAYVRDPEQLDRMEAAMKRTMKYGALRLDLLPSESTSTPAT